MVLQRSNPFQRALGSAVQEDPMVYSRPQTISNQKDQPNLFHGSTYFTDRIERNEPSRPWYNSHGSNSVLNSTASHVVPLPHQKLNFPESWKAFASHNKVATIVPGNWTNRFAGFATILAPVDQQRRFYESSFPADESEHKTISTRPTNKSTKERALPQSKDESESEFEDDSEYVSKRKMPSERLPDEFIEERALHLLETIKKRPFDEDFLHPQQKPGGSFRREKRRL